jgi:hypothetical protein
MHISLNNSLGQIWEKFWASRQIDPFQAFHGEIPLASPFYMFEWPKNTHIPEKLCKDIGHSEKF